MQKLIHSQCGKNDKPRYIVIGLLNYVQKFGQYPVEKGNFRKFYRKEWYDQLGICKITHIPMWKLDWGRVSQFKDTNERQW